MAKIEATYNESSTRKEGIDVSVRLDGMTSELLTLSMCIVEGILNEGYETRNLQERHIDMFSAALKRHVKQTDVEKTSIDISKLFQ